MPKTKDRSKTLEPRGLTIFELLSIGSVILAILFWALGSRSNMQKKLYDEQRRARVSVLKENLSKIVQRDGSFPSDEQFENAATREKLFSDILADYGRDFLNDPKDKSLLISYSAEPEGCAPGSATLCTKVTVGLTLSNGDDFFKFSVKPGYEVEYLKQAAKELQQSN